MKTCFTLLFLYYSFFAVAQQETKVFHENKKLGYILYASNNAFCPVTLALDLTLENLSFSEGMKKHFLIPGKAEKVKLGELNVLSTREANKFSYTYISFLGNIDLDKYDTAYEYDLPYEKGKTFQVTQGYDGQFSHQNRNALDFSLPEGTEILAAREGIVVTVVQNNTKSCPLEECKNFANHVAIYHPDGTFAEYGHIEYNGPMVKPGDSVKKGQPIAYSGNTGWSTGPHLHFACYLPPIKDENMITTRFKINDGSKSVYLHEKAHYLKDY